MTIAQMGDRVTIHYIGTLDNGRIFDSADDDNPLSFVLGSGEVFPALEEAVAGMKVGAANNVEIPAEKAFGPHMKENMICVPRSSFPAGRELRVGEKISLSFGDGEERVMRIVRDENEEVTLDGNHPLAGLDLTFALQLVSIDEKGVAVH
ncbi:FKBP-type peptidyl-prolyl cis-trans isomerase 2 [Malonomonas rubra DSM 5091]|uniref:Peptidyl-prolyl cis-trans isomerase n=1 Tax=Malonomonas rubra DSM 5091 TaxID=1122189 RepID=A0A1M6LMV4_MALRU|nr:FKBP-type peptidyl-prolyl cis-trans isomerase [Malonomonas rubra]SHJ72527.1 FKBP-type peptidyl-prolyl cis-trans isomerase 2 [Malonomonas rubra DSM 5091]